MLRWIVGSGLKLQKLVLAAAAAVVVLGIIQVGQTRVDLLPEYQPPTVEVQTEALGLSAAEVEQLITVPLEQDLLVGVPFLDDITSVSLPGLSSVVMTFERGTDVLDARQVVQERLTQAVGVAGLPAVAKPPQMIQPVSSNSRVSMVKLTSDELSPIQMSVLARWVVSPRLLGVPGVANVSIWGNRERQLQVRVDPERLRERGVTLAQVVKTAGNALEVSPLSYLEASKPGTGGFIDTPNQRLNIFHEQPIATAKELSQVALEGPDNARPRTRGPLTLADVTEVVEDHQPLIGDTACAGGNDCLLLVIEKFPSANTGQVAKDVDAALAALRPGLGDMKIDSSPYRPASHIDSAFSNLGLALLAGGILLVLVLFVLMRDWRRTVVVLAGITVSLSAAILVLKARDATVNLLVLTGLVVGLTAMIGDAVTDTSGIAARLRRHRETGTSAPVWGTIVESSVGLRRSALFAALVVGAATAPLFFLRNEGGAFAPPIVLSYLLALGVSFLVALLLVPVLCMTLLSDPAVQQATSDSRLRRWYDDTAAKTLTRTTPALVVAAGLALVGLVAVPFLDMPFRPSLDERHVVVTLAAPPGTSLPRMTAVATRAVDDLNAVPGVAEANAQIGRAVMSDKVIDVNESEVWLAIDGDADYDSTLGRIRDTVARYGVKTDVRTYTDQRLAEVFDGNESDVTVRVYGEDADVLTKKAREVRAAVADVEGVTRAGILPSPKETTLEVQVDLDRAQELAVTPGDVRRAAAILVGGITVGNLFQDQKVFDVVVWGAPNTRENVRDLRDLLIDTPSGGSIRLGDVADVRETPNDAAISHENVARFVEVTADVSGRSVADVNDEVTEAVSAIEFPLNHHAEVLGDYAETRDAILQVLTIALAAAIVIFLLLHSAFRSWRLAALAFLALPLSLVGGLAATLVTDGTVTLGVLAGLVAVLGVAAYEVVSCIEHLLYLQRREHLDWGRDLVVRGSRERLVPALTVAAATAAVLGPVAVLGGRTGLELLGPAAIAVLGGVVTTTVVTAVVVPTLALRFGTGPDRDSWIDDLYEPAPDEAPVRA